MQPWLFGKQEFHFIWRVRCHFRSLLTKNSPNLSDLQTREFCAPQFFVVGIDWLQASQLYPEPEDTCYVNVALSCFGVQRQTVQPCSCVLELGCRFLVVGGAPVVVAMLKTELTL